MSKPLLAAPKSDSSYHPPEARSRRLCLPALAVEALAIDNERLTA
jgi:hypothetical protein